MQQRVGEVFASLRMTVRVTPRKSFDLRAENAYYGVPLPRLSFAEIFPEEFRGYSA
jgi:hypothetical protein